LGTYLENVGRDPEAAYYADLCFLKPDRARMLMGRAPARDPRDSPVYDAVTAPYLRCPSASAVQRAEYADLKIYLANDVLVKVDRMSMQHSLEVRCPLLDRRLVELAFRIPQELKQADRRGKHLLKQLALRRLPSEVVAQPKQGFTVPIGAWLAGPLSARFEADVLNTRASINGLIDLAYVRRAFHEHRNGHADHQYLLWAVWALERWSANQRRKSSVPSPQAPEVPA
jgi:asparagine synthase (glutamine-hydrolysing)